MKKRIIYLLMGVIGTVGFTGCGPGQNTTQDNTGTYESPTGTQMGTQTQDRTATTVGTNGNRTATTGTSGTRTTTATGTAGTTTGNTGQRTRNATNDVSGAGTTQGTQISTSSGQVVRDRNNFELREAADYSYNNENFRFTPDQRGINITRNQNGTHTPFGMMRSFGDDGYYMVTTTNASGDEEVAVGRFDEAGNFTIYRYDRNGDLVTEQRYRSRTPMNDR